jgi:hypothetical protein
MVGGVTYRVVKDPMATKLVVLIEPNIELADSHRLETSIATELLVESDEHLSGRVRQRERQRDRIDRPAMVWTGSD